MNKYQIINNIQFYKEQIDSIASEELLNNRVSSNLKNFVNTFVLRLINSNFDLSEIGAFSKMMDYNFTINNPSIINTSLNNIYASASYIYCDINFHVNQFKFDEIIDKLFLYVNSINNHLNHTLLSFCKQVLCFHKKNNSLQKDVNLLDYIYLNNEIALFLILFNNTDCYFDVYKLLSKFQSDDEFVPFTIKQQLSLSIK
ncbi:MAG: hypothetical protein IJ911_12255 [Salinivirgaceae bacterium]|nr:hypothetical protein [Salinivirgaceae bacterium]